MRTSFDRYAAARRHPSNPATPSRRRRAPHPGEAAPIDRRDQQNDPLLTARTLAHGHRVRPGRPEFISNVRSLIRGVVGFAVVSEDALLVASEVATNAIRHSRSGEPRGTFSVAVEVRASGSRRTLRIEIGDLGPRRLVPDELCEARPGDEGSRGLLLVDTLADRWGIQPTPTGKRVWLELDWKNGDETRTLPQQRR